LVALDDGSGEELRDELLAEELHELRDDDHQRWATTLCPAGACAYHGGVCERTFSVTVNSVYVLVCT